MINFRIPTIEEIYNEYHRETMYASKNIYPRSIKNFDKVLNDQNIELLKKFQNVIKMGDESLNWKIYIKACSIYFKGRFDIKVLGSFKGNKIYRDYLRYNSLNFEKSNDEIKDEVIKSLQFLSKYLKDSGMSLKDYIFNRDSIIPVMLKHIHAGSISLYLYSCLSMNKIYKFLIDIPDDIFYELFSCSRNEFIEHQICKKHDRIIRISNLNDIINKINEKFNCF
jgi:hypothetical protein